MAWNCCQYMASVIIRQFSHWPKLLVVKADICFTLQFTYITKTVPKAIMNYAVYIL